MLKIRRDASYHCDVTDTMVPSSNYYLWDIKDNQCAGNTGHMQYALLLAYLYYKNALHARFQSAVHAFEFKVRWKRETTHLNTI